MSVTKITDPDHPDLQLMHALMATINAAGVSHGTALDALLSLYGATLRQYPCCYEGGAEGLQLQMDMLKAATDAYTDAAGLVATGAIAHAARKTH